MTYLVLIWLRGQTRPQVWNVPGRTPADALLNFYARDPSVPGLDIIKIEIFTDE